MASEQPVELTVSLAKRMRAVIIGGGFGGLEAAKTLSRGDLDVVLIDQRNFHLFQPLLYQVATGNLSPGEIAAPFRSIFHARENVTLITGRVTDIDPQKRIVHYNHGRLHYDLLVVAAGSVYNYFGHDEWNRIAIPLKTLEDALNIRNSVLTALELAEHEPNRELRRALMTFVVVGAGPTGVELAGALAELTHHTLVGDFQNIDSRECLIMLVQAEDRILNTYRPRLSYAAERKLLSRGVTVLTSTQVIAVEEGRVTAKGPQGELQIPTTNVLWAAGVKTSPLARTLKTQAGIQLDRAGRVEVADDFSLPGFPEIFVIGDLAAYRGPDGSLLPGLAQVAIQEGRYVGRRIIYGENAGPFRYRDYGQLSVIGRNAAVAQIGRLQINGFFAWLLWAVVHIWYLIGFDSKLKVLMSWGWNYITSERGDMLITKMTDYPLGMPHLEKAPKVANL